MNYGLTKSPYVTMSDRKNSADGDYHHHRPHSEHHNNHSTADSSYETENYTNGFENNYLFNGHQKDDKQQQQPASLVDEVDEDEHETEPDRPRLLMWGLTK